MFRDKTRVRRLGVALVLALGSTACGTAGGTADNDPGGVASLGTDTTTTLAEDTTVTSSDVEAPADPNEALLLYDQCMAQEGFPTDAASQAHDGPTVELDEAGGSDEGEGPTQHFIGPGGVEIAPEDIEEFETAHQECEAHLANLDQGEEFTPEQQAALDDAQLRVQQCLDEEGIDFHFSIAGSGDEAGIVENEETDEPPPTNQGQVDQEELEAAMDECMAIFDEYPELAGVLPPTPGN